MRRARLVVAVLATSAIVAAVVPTSSGYAVPSARHERSDPFRPFNGHGSRYVDDVRSWQTDEPALDMTGAAILASATQLAIHR